MSIFGWAKNLVVNFPGHGGNPDRPDAMSPTVESWQDELRLVRTLYNGWTAVRAESTRLLPRHPKEDADDYRIRANRPTYFNAFARTTRALAGMVFRTEPVAEAIPSEILALYTDDIDNRGTTGPTFLRNVFRDALVTGLSCILVDMPEAPEGLTRLQEMELGIRPFWTHIPKDNVISFRPEVINGRMVLVQFAFRECLHVPSGRYGVVEIDRLRVFRRDDAGVTFEVHERSSRDQEFRLISSGVMRGVSEIPVAPIYTEQRGFFDASPPLIDLGILNLLHYQTWSDLAHAAHVANVPVLFGKGMPADAISIGPNSAVVIENADEAADLKWLETTGASIGSTRALLADMEAQMAALGLGMLTRPSRVAETAEAKAIAKGEQDSALVSIVNDVENGLELALWFTAQFLGLASGGRFEISKSFEGEPAAVRQPELAQPSPEQAKAA